MLDTRLKNLGKLLKSNSKSKRTEITGEYGADNTHKEFCGSKDNSLQATFQEGSVKSKESPVL